MQYKGYTSQMEFDKDSQMYFGKVIGIKDIITFQGHTKEEAEQEFKNSVDDYLDFCRETGNNPETSLDKPEET